MKRIIIDAYRFLYLLTRAKNFSIYVAIGYVTILNMVMLCGLALLMQGWMPTAAISRLFTFPYYIVTAAGMLWLTTRFKPSNKSIAKEAKTTKDYTFLIIYSLAALILFLYMRYGVNINFSEPKRVACFALARLSGCYC